METNGVSVYWVCVCSPWCRTQGPALGKVVTAGNLCGVRCKCCIWTFWRSMRGRIYSRAKSTHCTLQIEMKSGSKLLPLMALLPEWIGGAMASHACLAAGSGNDPTVKGLCSNRAGVSGCCSKLLLSPAHCPLYLQNSCFAVTAFLCKGKKV